MSASERKRPLRVLSNTGYPVSFTIDLGQRNATITRRDLCPRWRALRGYDRTALTLATGWRHDLLHTWNAVPLLAPRPFLVTFEATLPRVWDDPRQRAMRRRLLHRLAGPRCAGLLAISDYARRMMRRSNAHAPDLLAAIDAKVQVLYPAIAPRRTVPKRPGDVLRLAFVGREFMRKGAAAVTRAHASLRRRGVPVETHIVSRLAWSPRDYTGPFAGFDFDAEKRRVGQEGITWIESAANQQVLELLERVDYCLLPTVHDTFGFGLLEALAAGTPVIATETCAIPEIVENGSNGYLLPIEAAPDLRQWVWLTRKSDPGYNEAFLHLMDRLGEALADRLEACWLRRNELYEPLSHGALASVRAKFDRHTQRDRLETLYETAVG